MNAKRLRSVVSHCGICALDFESRDSERKHMQTQKHKRCRMAYMNFLMDESEKPDAGHISGSNVEYPDERQDLNANESDAYDSDGSDYDPDFLDQASDLDNDLDGLADEYESEDGENAGEGDFFPFPDEMFFLLYCYVHNIMRHKVKYGINTFLFHFIYNSTPRL